MMSVFEEYYENDVQDMARSRVNSTCVDTSVDVRAKEFDLYFSGRLIRCKCLTWTLVPLNLVNGVWMWMSCSKSSTCTISVIPCN